VTQSHTMIGLTDCYAPDVVDRGDPLDTSANPRPPHQFRQLRVVASSPLIIAVGATVVHAAVSLLPNNRQQGALECSLSYSGTASSYLNTSYLAARLRDSLEGLLLLEAYSNCVCSRTAERWWRSSRCHHGC
jgi:hypothetical protein